MSYQRSSPIPEFPGVAKAGESHGMRYVAQTGEDYDRLSHVALADLSRLPRFGLKGPLAAAWLEAQGLPVPPSHNRWVDSSGGGIVARLGRTEFFLEEGPRGDAVQRARKALGSGSEGVYPVIRQDAGILLAGPRSNELLVQTCNVNFEAIAAQEAVMTQMVGVSILAIRQDRGALPAYRLWCDPTFAPYLWETLLEIAAGLGGGAIGIEGLPQ